MKKVYLCFSTDIIHSGHIDIIDKAAKLGEVTVGVLSDEAVMSYKRFPLISYDERKRVFEHIKNVSRVVLQKTISYKENILALKPDYVVHGDDWKTGFQKPVRDEVVKLLKSYGGELVEFPYNRNPELEKLEKNAREQLSVPDMRRGRLKKILGIKGFLTAI